MENNTEKRGKGRPKGAKSTRTELLKKKNKEILLTTLKSNLGIIGPAVKAASISRETFNVYYNEDLDFQQKVNEIREDAIDYVEGQLFNQIKQGAAAQTIFYLKTKGKSRGYIEQTDTNMTIDAIKIKYIVPSEKDSQPILPFNNDNITLQLPE